MILQLLAISLCIPLQCVLGADKDVFVNDAPKKRTTEDAYQSAIYTLDSASPNKEYLLKVDPSHTCNRVVMCAYDESKSACNQSAQIAFLPGLEEPLIKWNLDAPSSKLLKVDDFFVRLVRDKTKSQTFELVTEDGTAVTKLQLGSGSKLQISGPSPYCRVELADAKTGAKLDQVTIKDAKKEQYPTRSKKLSNKHLGPMYQETKTDFMIKEARDDEGFCSSQDLPTDFFRLSSLHKTRMPEFDVGEVFYRYSIFVTDRCPSKPEDAVYSLIIEHDMYDYVHENNECRGFSLCFFTGRKEHKLCTDKAKLLEIYPMNMIMIGPQDDHARPIRSYRNHLQYFRVSFLKKGNEYVMAVGYDPLNNVIDGSVEYFPFSDSNPFAAGSEVFVDLVTTGLCKIRLATDDRASAGQCLAASKCQKYVKI